MAQTYESYIDDDIDDFDNDENFDGVDEELGSLWKKFKKARRKYSPVSILRRQRNRVAKILLKKAKKIYIKKFGKTPPKNSAKVGSFFNKLSSKHRKRKRLLRRLKRNVSREEHQKAMATAKTMVAAKLRKFKRNMSAEDRLSAILYMLPKFYSAYMRENQK